MSSKFQTTNIQQLSFIALLKTTGYKSRFNTVSVNLNRKRCTDINLNDKVWSFNFISMREISESVAYHQKKDNYEVKIGLSLLHSVFKNNFKKNHNVLNGLTTIAASNFLTFLRLSLNVLN